MKLVKVNKISYYSPAKAYKVLLIEEKSSNEFCVIVGTMEAQSIAMEIEKIIPNRPMTHDLFKSFLKKINFVVNEVLITDIKDGVFFSKIIISDSTKKHSIDARPSDAIAIAIRYKANIYVDERVLDEAGIIFDEAEVDKKVNDDGKVKTLKDFSVKELNKKLTDSIAEENYEFAARVRDEIKRRN